jgi:CBS domain-containing protein
MTFIVFDQGLRTHTPWYDIFPPKNIEALSASAPIRALASDDDNKESGASNARQSAVSQFLENEAAPEPRHPLTLASQIMTAPAVYIEDSLTILEAWQIFSKQRFRHLAVTNKAQELTGIVSDRDILLASSTLSRGKLSNLAQSVSSIMKRRVLSAQESTPIRHMAKAICNHRIGALPIVNEENRVMGIVTRSDIMGAIINEAPLELWA